MELAYILEQIVDVLMRYACNDAVLGLVALISDCLSAYAHDCKILILFIVN